MKKVSVSSDESRLVYSAPSKVSSSGDGKGAYAAALETSVVKQPASDTEAWPTRRDEGPQVDARTCTYVVMIQ